MGTSWKRVVSLYAGDGINDTVKMRHQARPGRQKDDEQVALQIPNGPTSTQFSQKIGLMKVIQEKGFIFSLDFIAKLLIDFP